MIMISSRLLLAVAILAPVGLFAQLPEGPGKEQTIRLCSQCHEVESAVAVRQDKDGWRQTVQKMVGLGLQVKEDDIRATVDYLAKNFPADPIRKLNVNTATSIELQSALSMRRSQAAAVIEYRAKNGNFKSIDDLKKVPGIDAAKIDAKKERLTF
jgi:competence protein ComEA